MARKYKTKKKNVIKLNAFYEELVGSTKKNKKNNIVNLNK
tara:strand:+ start:717 stop:836 length:120 start_codon:yes stop_codon:yes gene_type:complete